jgi:PIN domain nuclease of toxin-antitoxin system
VKLLIDTHLLLWAAAMPERLSPRAVARLEAPENRLLFSAASLWEIAIKATLGRSDFTVDPRRLRQGLIDNGYEELPLTGAHALALADLPAIHKDPFDRILIAQAKVEGLALLTADAALARYGAPVEMV